MLPPYAWRTESLLLILVGVMACMLVGGVATSLVPEGQWDWVRFLVATVSLHAAALLVVHAVMREVGLGWRLAFGFGRGRLWRVLSLGVITGLMVLPLAWLASWMTAEVMRLFFVEPAPQEVVTTLRETEAWWAYGLMGFMAVTVAPVAEEVLFRGLLYPFLKERLRTELAVAVSAAAFGVIHMNLVSFPSLVFLAVVLIWLYEVTGNLLTPIAAHAAFNLANLLLLLTL